MFAPKTVEGLRDNPGLIPEAAASRSLLFATTGGDVASGGQGLRRMGRVAIVGCGTAELREAPGRMLGHRLGLIRQLGVNPERA
jgi:hypothetical protein